MANFGVSVGDIVTVGSLAWNVYKSCSNASSEFQEVAREVVSLHATVKQLELEATKPDSIVRRAVDARQKEFATLIQNIEQVLKQLDELVSKYKSLGTKHRKKRDVLRFSSEGLDDIRSKIILHTSAATLFIGTLSAASLGRIETKLDAIVKELRNGQRNTSAIALSDDEDDPVAVKQWRTLRKELVSDGFQQDEIETHKAWIKVEMRKRIAQGENEPQKAEPTTKLPTFPAAIDNRTAAERQLQFGGMGYDFPRYTPSLTNPWMSAPPTGQSQTYATSLPQPSAAYTSYPIASTATGAEKSGFSDALDATRGMVAMSITDITPRNIYGASKDSDTEGEPDEGGIDRYGFPTGGSKLRRSPSVSSMSSTHSEVAEYDSYGNMTKKTVTTKTTTYFSASMSDCSAASDQDLGSPRVLPSPNTMFGPGMPPAPQLMMGQFSSKVSSSSQKKHKCNICDKRFTRPSSLQTHMYSHTGEKPFACDFEGCGRHFSVVSNLRRHRKVHQAESRSVQSDADSESELA